MKLNYQLACGCKNSKKIKIFTYHKAPLLELNYAIKGKYESLIPANIPTRKKPILKL